MAYRACRRGSRLARLLSRVSRYEIEVQQGSALWRTDAVPSAGFKLIATREPSAGEKAAMLAVGLSITGSLDSDVQRHLDSINFAGAVLLLEPASGPSRDVFKTAGNVVAFTNEAKQSIRQCVDEAGATEIVLFYFGPLSGACFLGHDLNALGARVTIMEDQSPGYAPAFRFG